MFGGDPQKFSSWLCIPNMEVSGTVIVDGVAREVHGTGYHDHRCMAINDLEAWHHWLWGRQVFENHTAVIYDYVASKQYGFAELPLFAVYDKDGNVIYDNGTDGTMKREILETAHDLQSRRDYPKRTRYTFAARDGRIFTYELDGEEVIEVRELCWTVPEKQREMFDMLGLQVCYNRYYAHGRLTVADEAGTETCEEGRLTCPWRGSGGSCLFRRRPVCPDRFYDAGRYGTTAIPGYQESVLDARCCAQIHHVV